jgi:hypothetical protein
MTWYVRGAGETVWHVAEPCQADRLVSTRDRHQTAR